jgi:DNA polymerase III epsilon subunit family exonuclease
MLVLQVAKSDRVRDLHHKRVQAALEVRTAGEHAFVYPAAMPRGSMQLALDSLDRLVELVEEHGGRVRASEAARHLFAVSQAPEGLARTLLAPLVEDDARLGWRGSFVSLASAPDPLLVEAEFVVFDLETTGLSHASARICEIGAARIRHLELAETFQTLVAPGTALPNAVRRITGLSDEELRRAPGVRVALRRFSAFAGGAVLVAHNARFDVGFVNRELERMTGKRLAATVIDTVPLARNMLQGRVQRTSLATLAHFFGVSVRPCHRALPDAQATAEVFLRLVELAGERGASTLSELEELAAPRPRRIHAKRRLIHGAPTRPGVYLFLDAGGTVLYVGKARDLRARLRSYFQSRRQRSAVEAALDQVERIEWRILGSELAAALEEVRLIRALRPPANARTPTPESYVYLHKRGERVVLSRAPSRYGPLRGRADAQRAARALRGCSADEFAGLLAGAPLEPLRRAVTGLFEIGHDLDAARLRRLVVSLERVVAQLRELDRLRRLELCVVVPSLQPGGRDAYTVSAGRVTLRRLAPGTDPTVAPGDPPDSIEADSLDELLVVSSFLASPPPELKVIRA